MSEASPHLTFVIGEEKRLGQVISRAEIEPLLRSALKAGLVRVAVVDEENLPMCSVGDEGAEAGITTVKYPLLLEGEPCGQLVADGNPADPSSAALGTMLRDALQMTLNNNLRRMLTTEVHTSIVQESYEQLVEVNRRLSESEARYRNLAVSLEQKVEQRTAELQRAYSRMLQQEKMASIGQLAAGMAHEINNPTGFILSNLTTFRKYVLRLKEMLDLFRLLSSKSTPIENLRLQTEARWRELKLDFVLEDAPELLAQSIQGAERIKQIVADLKSFSHVDETPAGNADLNAELQRTLSVLASQIRPDTEVITEFGQLPPYHCNPALLCQAFLGLLQNSLQSRNNGLRIRVSTSCEEGAIVIVIGDNGCGIPKECLSRVFDPFFTTREVGQGTGMGLTVVREIINSCGGTIDIASEEGSGTAVTLRLPTACSL